ncbi:MAG: sporulation initiation factor Spo0A C-terminal domain-containing protein [Ruminococcus sp.]|nr:sporulation initiation factor Spo0A C-terminal domain-containing protein [Ruminococcus sp.]MDE6784709.1 sporulation initiation factor Spo0A C-terminal domain-containing protein [Ruminococcus sp.]
MYRLLFGNYISGLGAGFAKYISHFQFETSYCGNNKDTLMKNLHDSHYDALVFFESSPNEKAVDFIKECKSEFPELKIYVILFIDSMPFIQEAESYSDVVCIVAPVMESEICRMIAYDFYSSDEMPILPEVAGFLIEKGFRSGLIGFYYLGCAITIVLRDKSMLNRVMTDLYPAAAEYMNTTTAHIERAIRVMCDIAFSRGVMLNDSITNKRPPNKKLIYILAKEYIKKNKDKGQS